MITTNFVIVTGLLLITPDEHMVEYDFHPIPPISITFSGNKIVSMRNPVNEETGKEESMYGRIVLAYEIEELKSLYLILKNRTIFSVDSWTLDEINTAIMYHETIKDFDSVKLARAFVNL